MGDIRFFRVEGHAGFAQAGQDIVCAGVSALTVSAVNGLEKYLSVPPVYRAEDGFLECTLKRLTTDQDRLMARAILGAMLQGLEGIRESHASRFVMFEQRRWTPC